jgi:serine/threonine-protein kinase
MTELLDGRYRLIEQVAQGGSSTVWRGYDERLSRPVAVKVLTDPKAHWIRDEARTLAQLTHPHIATVYDVGEHYLVAELVDGDTLASTLAGGPLGWPAAAVCCAQVASALAAAHARGLVHRDVTPANIMLTAGGAKLIDFGISTFEGADEADADGNVHGTPPYAAPERLTQRRVAPAADIYGLGVVLYQALSGRLPIAGTNALDGVDGLPPAVGRACRSCLAHDPAARPSAAELADVLQAHAPPSAVLRATAGAAPVVAAPSMTRVMPTMAQPVGAGRRIRTGWVAAGVVVLLLGLAGGLAIGLGLAGDSPRPDAAATTAGPACSVSYQLTSDDGNTFVADIVATNGGLPLGGGWRLTMRLPTDESKGLRPSGEWSVDGSALASPAQNPLATGSTARMTLTARHSKTTVLPSGFDIGGHACSASVLGPDGSPLVPGSAFTATTGNNNGDHGHDGGGDHGGPGHG